MITRPRLFALAALILTGSLSYVPITDAVVIRIGSGGRPMLMLRVGQTGSRIDTVEFPILTSEVGDGTPITGTPDIRIRMRIRARPAFSRVATLTVDSSTPLSNGAATVPMSNISWISLEGDIPSGTFNETTSQFIASYPNSFQVRDTHRFRYANTLILQPGTYSGRVTYTLTMP